MTLHLLFSHRLTQEQQEDAKDSLQVEEIQELPVEMRELWSNIPPELESLEEYLMPLKTYLTQKAIVGDFVLISGDFGAVFLMVHFCKECGLIPIYSTTKRISTDILEEGKVRRVSIFRHIRFRAYEA